MAVKAGRTLAGRKAAGSHTAALAANDVAVEALFRQTGVIRAESLDELFDIAATLGSQPLVSGRRAAIVTNAGGPGILCADACESEGLFIPELSATVQSTLRTFLPAAASLGNPVDMVASASPDSYTRTIEAVLSSADIDALIVIYIPVDRDDSSRMSAAIRDGIERGRTAGGTGKPVLACLMARDSRQAPLLTRDETIPVYAFPESAARVLAKCAAYSDWRRDTPGIVSAFDDVDLDEARSIVRQALNKGGAGWLTPVEVRGLLGAFRISQPESQLAQSADEAVRIADAIGFPVAMKLVSSTILHKTEAHGVQLNLNDADAVRRAFAAIASTEGVVVQKMVEGGVELMMGVTDDPLFGPLVAFGLGGIHVEILKDVRFRVTPLTDKDVREMVRDIRGYPLLEGYRGHPPADIAAIENTLLRLSRMVEEISEITELDLNPIIALAPGQGCLAVDARVRVG